jgi:rRNA-processing protein FCF1
VIDSRSPQDVARGSHARAIGRSGRRVGSVAESESWDSAKGASATSRRLILKVRTMAILLRPGRTCGEATKLLDEIVQGDLNNVRNAIPHSGAPGFPQLMGAAVRNYESWTGEVSRKLREVFTSSELTTRVRGEKYWIIVAGDASSPRTASMMHSELSDLTQDFIYTANELRELQARFAGHAGRCLVLDTNDFLHYQRFDYIPWSTIYRKDAWVVVPHVVLDEIDRKSYEEGSKIHKRARGAYKLLEGLFGQIDSDGYTTLRDGSLCLIMADDPGHIRLPNNDDEIVARAAFLQQALNPGQVTIITRDIGMRARAMAQRLRAESLPENYLLGDGLSSAKLNENLAALSDHSVSGNA